MIAFPQRGPRSLVAILAIALVLPVMASAQEMAGSAALGEPIAVTDPLPRAVPATVWSAASFRDRQLRFPRVRSAYEVRADDVRRIFRQHDIDGPAEIFFRVFKREQLMEVWARGQGAGTFVLVNTYAMCGSSGDLGAKRERGDEQIPEGFYSIDVFNPASRFHLSLGVNYPNAVDRARGAAGNLGGDIFIHGGCATVGCVPVTDAGIEEVYVMALMARDAGQERIPVHMFPTRLDDDGFAWLRETFGPDHPDFGFWENLREGYLAFEGTRTIPHIDHYNGRYTFLRGVPTTGVATAGDHTPAEAAASPSVDRTSRPAGPLGAPVRD
jgi:murein L,D-transpeptidase YafK